MYKVESGIPLKERVYGRHAVKYPFENMNIGDSFFMEVETNEHRVLRTTAQASVHGRLREYKKSGRVPESFKIATRFVDNGVRVWRTA